MRDREGGDDDDERLEAAEGDDEAEEEQQVVGAVEDVEEAQLDESPRRLVPARIEPHDAGIAPQLECPFHAAWSTKSQRRHDAHAEPAERGIDCELRSIGCDRVSKRTSISAWFHTSAVSGASGGPVTWPSAVS